jgi:peptidoglycan hydrolase-like protein with peptidoglycan-binding domain
MGHIALCDGNGGTVEAKGRRYGVVADTVHGRTWNAGMLIPGINYGAAPAAPPKVEPPEIVYEPGAKNMQREIIFNIQQALLTRGFDPGEISGDYDAATQNAVADFQRAMGLVVDGAVGPETAESLGISLVGGEVGPIQPGIGGEGLDANRLLALLLALFGSAAQSPGKGADKPEQIGDYLQTLLPLLLPLLLQATPAGPPLQVAELLLKLLAAKPGGAPTPTPPPTDVLTLLLQLLGGRRSG